MEEWQWYYLIHIWGIRVCDNPPSRSPNNQLLWNNSVLAGDSSSGFRRGISHFFMATRNTTEGVREKEQRTIWAWVNSKCKEGGSVTLHSLCICRLSLTCSFRETSTSYQECQLIFDRLPHCWPLSTQDCELILSVFLTVLGLYLTPSILFCCPLSTAALHLTSPTAFSEFLFSSCLLWRSLVHFRSRRIYRAQAFGWSRAKTDKGIVCLVDHPHSVTGVHIFPNGINPKVNVIARLEIELTSTSNSNISSIVLNMMDCDIELPSRYCVLQGCLWH